MIVLKKNSRIGRAQMKRTGSAKVGHRMADPKSDRDTADATARFKTGQTVKIGSGKHAGRAGPIAWVGASKFGSIRVGVRIGDDVVFVDQSDIDVGWKPPRTRS